MKRIVMALAVLVGTGAVATSAKGGDPWRDPFAHRAFHRRLAHERFHDHLAHEAFHDYLRHRELERLYRHRLYHAPVWIGGPSYGHWGYVDRSYCAPNSFYISGPRMSFGFAF